MNNLIINSEVEMIPDPGAKIILTIAIPTFNGESTLRRALESILPQVTPNVEIVVSDNCSYDTTKNLLQDFISKHDCIKYFCNDKNVGYDRNVDIAMQRAKGDFVWLLGDDDVILPGGITEILNIIALNPAVGIIYANSPNSIKIEKGAAGICYSGDEFFARNKFKSGFLSTNIFNRKLWTEINLSKYFDTGWVHIGFLIEALPKCYSYVTEKFCVDQIRDMGIMTRWGGKGTFIYTGIELVKIYSLMSTMSYSRKTMRNAYWTIKGAYWRNIPLAKAQGFKLKLSVVNEFFNLYKTFISFWIIDIPLLIIPRIFYKLLYLIYKKYLKHIARLRFLILNKLESS